MTQRFLVLVLFAGAFSVIAILPTGIALANRGADAGAIIGWRGLVDAYEDMKKADDLFEFWTLTCEKPLPSGKCVLMATSFSSMSGQTHVHQWHHEASAIRRLSSAEFRLSMNGRFSDCSGLEVTLTLDDATESIRDLEGTMLSGSKCQSILRFRPDVASVKKQIDPIFNQAVGWNMLKKKKQDNPKP